MLFGNFVELLDDVVPAMWAEMLNDRSFAGVLPASSWSYYDGKPDFCDREWDRNSTWEFDTTNLFNAMRTARLTPTRGKGASLTQSGLAVKSGRSYHFSGWFRAERANATVTIRLKTLLPTGDWMMLATGNLKNVGTDWSKHSAVLISKGESDRVVFELLTEGKWPVWVSKVSLMPADNLNGWRPDVVQAIKDVQPAVLRWGGSTCDPGQYRWKKGIGPRDLRVPFPNKVWGRIDPNDVGIDEFCQLCELVGVEPLICLSFSDGPQSAADLVEYCNGSTNTAWGAKRAANGHPSAYRVKYWQIGNEINGDDPHYLSSFADFVRAMKSADPGVRLMASFPAQNFVEKFGKDLAYVCPHHYTPDFVGCDRDFVNLSQMIDRTPGCANVRIAVTEWNVTAGDWGLGRGKMLTLDSALLNVRYLHVLMRHSDKLEIACRSNLANSYAGAIIETSPGGLLKRPSYYAMQLYAQHIEPVPLRLDSTVPALDLFACASADRKKVCLFAINPDAKPATLAINFDGFAPAVHATGIDLLCDTLDRGQPDVMNHWEAPDRVRLVHRVTSTDRIVLPALSAAAIECGAR